MHDRGFLKQSTDSGSWIDIALELPHGIVSRLITGYKNLHGDKHYQPALLMFREGMI
jgi:hypothetical protein